MHPTQVSFSIRQILRSSSHCCHTSVTRMADPNIEAYFAQYPLFDFRPSRSDWRQVSAFNALAKDEKWSQDERSLQYDSFKYTWKAVIDFEFSGSTLQHYQNLCWELRVNPVPSSKEECRRTLRSVYVNVVDLVQYRRDMREGRTPVEFDTYSSLDELKRNSDKGKWIPPDISEAELFKVLLKVFQESSDDA